MLDEGSLDSPNFLYKASNTPMFEKSKKNNKTGIENDIDKKWQGYSTASDKATAMRSQERNVSFRWS